MPQAIHLDDETEALIASEVAAGQAKDAADFVKRAVRGFIDDREIEAFRLGLDRSRASIAGTGDEVLDRIEARIRARM